MMAARLEVDGQAPGSCNSSDAGSVLGHAHPTNLGERKMRKRSSKEIGRAGEPAARKAKRSKSSSRFRGVSWFKANNVWKAQITVKGNYKFLGYFEREEEAAWAYDLRALQMHGQDAQLNFPDRLEELRAAVASGEQPAGKAKPQAKRRSALAPVAPTTPTFRNVQTHECPPVFRQDQEIAATSPTVLASLAQALQAVPGCGFQASKGPLHQQPSKADLLQQLHESMLRERQIVNAFVMSQYLQANSAALPMDAASFSSYSQPRVPQAAPQLHLLQRLQRPTSPLFSALAQPAPLRLGEGALTAQTLALLARGAAAGAWATSS